MSGGSLQIDTLSPEQTRELGRRIGERCGGGELIALIGELGSGKTQLAKGLAAGLGVDRPDQLTSPTFVIVNEYPGRLTLYHIDAYRLNGPGELEALGADDLLAAGSVVAIEWADRVESWLPPEALIIRLEITGTQQRRLTMAWADEAAEALAECAARDVAR